MINLSLQFLIVHVIQRPSHPIICSCWKENPCCHPECLKKMTAIPDGDGDRCSTSLNCSGNALSKSTSPLCRKGKSGMWWERISSQMTSSRLWMKHHHANHGRWGEWWKQSRTAEDMSDEWRSEQRATSWRGPSLNYAFSWRPDLTWLWLTLTLTLTFDSSFLCTLEEKNILLVFCIFEYLFSKKTLQFSMDYIMTRIYGLWH